MRPLLQEFNTAHTPESLVENLRGERGIILLRTSQFDSPLACYSIVAANPLLTFRSSGSRCEIFSPLTEVTTRLQFGNPWRMLDALMACFELLEEVDRPFPLGGAFGYWGYDLKNFAEPKLPRRVANDLGLPDCHVGFYDSLVVFDHRQGSVCVVSTGLSADGSRSESRAKERLKFWENQLAKLVPRLTVLSLPLPQEVIRLHSNCSREKFLSIVEQAQRYIRSGDIYQVNLSHRLTAQCAVEAWEFFQRLSAVSPAPFAAFMDCDGGAGQERFQIASSSPEQFLGMSGSRLVTRPIKGTRPRNPDPARDEQLARELQTSPKELAELVMITDLLRNDLGRVCQFGSVQTPDLARLEKYAQVQHLVSTVEGRLNAQVSHFTAFARCFPGGSITGAPKFRAMEIIDELETVSRGPYCGSIGYLGFNRESQLNIAIRTAICLRGEIHFSVGAGIVADSRPAAEYAETLDKARGFMAALGHSGRESIPG